MFQLDKIQFKVKPAQELLSFRLSPLERDIDYLKVVIPSANQTVGSCDCQATMNHIETSLRLRDPGAFKTKQQLDAERLYWTWKKKTQGSRWKEDTGLPLIEGLQAAIEFGVVPPDTEIVEIKPSPEAILEALKRGTFIQGHLVGENWLPENVNPHTGEIPYVDVTPSNALGGHATHGIGVWSVYGDIWVVGQNSWVPYGRNGKSVFLMNWRTWYGGYKWIGQGPYQLQFGPQWATWEGWRDWVIKDETTAI